MIIHQTFAFILDSEVKQIICCETYGIADQLAKNMLGNKAYAVDVTQYRVTSGYKYIDGVFYDFNNNKVIRENTAEEDVKIAKTRCNELEEELNSQSDVLLENYETNIDNETAILELYESMIGE